MLQQLGVIPMPGQENYSMPFWRAANGDVVRAFTFEHVAAHLLPPKL
jgi:hypothetical protein